MPKGLGILYDCYIVTIMENEAIASLGKASVEKTQIVEDNDEHQNEKENKLFDCLLLCLFFSLLVLERYI